MLRLACCSRSTKKNERAVDEKKIAARLSPDPARCGFSLWNPLFSLLFFGRIVAGTAPEISDGHIFRSISKIRYSDTAKTTV
jgi:hypothetical protein